MAGADRMTIEEVVKRVLLDEHADVVREAVWAVAGEMMELEVSELIGAEHGERRLCIATPSFSTTVPAVRGLTDPRGLSTHVMRGSSRSTTPKRDRSSDLASTAKDRFSTMSTLCSPKVIAERVDRRF